MRTTLDLDAPVLEQLKALRIKEKRTLGQIASQLLAESLSRRATNAAIKEPLVWTSKEMGARVDLRDKDAVRRVLDQS